MVASHQTITLVVVTIEEWQQQCQASQLEVLDLLNKLSKITGNKSFEQTIGLVRDLYEGRML